jgi:hypothetical protein
LRYYDLFFNVAGFNQQIWTLEGGMNGIAEGFSQSPQLQP